MTEARTFTSWQTATLKPGKPYVGTSPTLLLLHDELVTMGLKSMGRNGYVVRPIRGGTAWSSHAYGAAIDLAWDNRELLDTVILPWLVGHSAELGIQRVHDYGRGRYWQAGAGWIGRPPGTGNLNSIHVEVVRDRWTDTTPIKDRITGTPTAPKYPGKPLQSGSTGINVKRVQEALGSLEVDGKFGPRTEAAVIAYQRAHNLKPDGIVGPVTWRHLFGS